MHAYNPQAPSSSASPPPSSRSCCRAWATRRSGGSSCTMLCGRRPGSRPSREPGARWRCSSCRRLVACGRGRARLWSLRGSRCPVDQPAEPRFALTDPRSTSHSHSTQTPKPTHLIPPDHVTTAATQGAARGPWPAHRPLRHPPLCGVPLRHQEAAAAAGGGAAGGDCRDSSG